MFNEKECKKSLKVKCSNFIIDGCVTLESSMNIFPKTKYLIFNSLFRFIIILSLIFINILLKRAPKSCSKRQIVKKIESLKEAKLKSSLTAYKETPELTNKYWCPSSFGAKSKIVNSNDPSLNAFLTQVAKKLFKYFIYFLKTVSNKPMKLFSQTDKFIIRRNLNYVVIMLSLLFTVFIVQGTIRAARKKNLYYTQVLYFYLKNFLIALFNYFSFFFK